MRIDASFFGPLRFGTLRMLVIATGLIAASLGAGQQTGSVQRYKDANVTVTAFATKHAMESYGYRFDTADRSIVISGDTSPTQATIDACRGCDVLIHEVNTLEGLSKRDARFQAFAAKYHTSTEQLAELAARAKPRLLVLYHHSIALRPGVAATASTPGELLREISARYSGQFVVGRDLDVY